MLIWQMATSCKFTTIEQNVSSVRWWYDIELDKYGHLANPLRDEQREAHARLHKKKKGVDGRRAGLVPVTTLKENRESV